MCLQGYNLTQPVLAGTLAVLPARHRVTVRRLLTEPHIGKQASRVNVSRRPSPFICFHIDYFVSSSLFCSNIRFSSSRQDKVKHSICTFFFLASISATSARVNITLFRPCCCCCCCCGAFTSSHRSCWNEGIFHIFCFSRLVNAGATVSPVGDKHLAQWFFRWVKIATRVGHFM